MGKRLDCVLISPPRYYKNEENIWRLVSSNFPPLGLASIAAYARSKGHSVRIIDCNAEGISVESFREYIKSFKDRFGEVRCIGLTATTSDVKKAYEIARVCHSVFPSGLIVFGGVHTTFVTREVMSNGFVDIAVIGEGEVVFEEILAGKPKGRIAGICYKKGNRVMCNKPRERIADLDMLPMPAYDLLPVLKYRPAKGSYKRLPAMSMMTSRGCPGKCTFCNKTLGSRLTFRSPEKTFEEIRFLKTRYGIKQIMFYDDTFTIHKGNVLRLCDLLTKNRAGISWTCFARVDFVNPNMLRRMKQAGCHQIMYGVENIDETVLKNIKKRVSKEMVVKAVKWTKEAGIECRLAFMVGNPGDTPEIIEKNIKFVNRLNPHTLIVNITTPFPGTEMFESAKRNGLILTYNWDDYDLSKPVMRLENMTPWEIQALYKRMFSSFYFRPRYVASRLMKIRSMQDIEILFGGLSALFSFFNLKDRLFGKERLA